MTCGIRKSFIICVILIFYSIGLSRVLRVGPGKPYPNPSNAALDVLNGDTVEIDAGEYMGDVAIWYPDNLLIKGVGGRAHLRANGAYVQGKGIWVIKGVNVTVENIEFSEASVPSQNGAGIRQDGGSLTVRNCFFHHNETGILGPDRGGTVIIEYCEFAYNGFGDGQSHNLYISNTDTLIFQYNYSHHANIGHNLKSRARTNFILYNRIMDEQNGNSSYAIDLPNGGLSYVIGNLLQQSPNTDNSTIFSYGAEGLSNPINELFFINNTMVNDRGSGNFLFIRQGSNAQIQNNLFVKNGNIYNGIGNLITNLSVSDFGFVNLNNFNYHLTSQSPAIDAGSNPGAAYGINLNPNYEYLHPAKKSPRNLINAIDVGAYEYQDITVLENKNNRSATIEIYPNFPNPFNAETIISFNLYYPQFVRVHIYNQNFEKLETLVAENLRSGQHKFVFDAKKYASGIYFYEINLERSSSLYKMVLMK